MPFREIYTTAFKNDIEYSQLVLQTAALLQSHKFMQVTKQSNRVLIGDCRLSTTRSVLLSFFFSVLLLFF